MFVINAKLVNHYNQVVCYAGYWVDKLVEGNKVKSFKLHISPKVASDLAIIYKLKHNVTSGVSVEDEDFKYTNFGSVLEGTDGLRFYVKDNTVAEELVEKITRESLLVNDKVPIESYGTGIEVIKDKEYFYEMGYLPSKDKLTPAYFVAELIKENCIVHVHEFISRLAPYGCKVLSLNDVSDAMTCNVVGVFRFSESKESQIGLGFKVRNGYVIDYTMYVLDHSTGEEKRLFFTSFSELMPVVEGYIG